VPDINGNISPGFERVADAFAAGDLRGGGAAFAAYVDGEKIADLWAGEARPGVPWAEDTLTTLFSSTKGCAALCAQILSDRGLLDVDAPVAQYWPEYAQAGKEATLVRHVLNHTSGMLCFEDPGALLDWEGNGWDDYDEIARRIAASPAAWEPGTKIEYHGISIGWLIQELVRRITGKTLGKFFADEVAGPLGLTLFIGTPESEHIRLADAVAEAPGEIPPQFQEFAEKLKELMSDPTYESVQAGVFMHGGTVTQHFDLFNRPNVRALEIPAANGSGDARSLARMYAALAQGGELDGVRLVSPASVKLFGTMTFRAVSAGWRDGVLPDWFPPTVMRYALGYEGDFGDAPKPWRFGPTPETFGHLGAGGQIGFADPVRHVSIGFLRNHFADWSVSTALVDALYACL
jgi:CubicO group peptidase (beta-lactamase class C family)